MTVFCLRVFMYLYVEPRQEIPKKLANYCILADMFNAFYVHSIYNCQITITQL